MIRLISLFIILISTQLSAQNFIGKKKDLDAIKNQAENLSAYFVDGDQEAIASIYMFNGMLLPPGRDIIKGRFDIEDHYTPKEDGSKIASHRIISKEILIEKKRTAYDYGYYEGSRVTSEGIIIPFKGKYVVIWKKIHDEWMIYLDIWNGIE